MFNQYQQYPNNNNPNVNPYFQTPTGLFPQPQGPFPPNQGFPPNIHGHQTYPPNQPQNYYNTPPGFVQGGINPQFAAYPPGYNPQVHPNFNPSHNTQPIQNISQSYPNQPHFQPPSHNTQPLPSQPPFNPNYQQFPPNQQFPYPNQPIQFQLPSQNTQPLPSQPPFNSNYQQPHNQPPPSNYLPQKNQPPPSYHNPPYPNQIPSNPQPYPPHTSNLPPENQQNLSQLPPKSPLVYPPSNLPPGAQIPSNQPLSQPPPVNRLSKEQKQNSQQNQLKLSDRPPLSPNQNGGQNNQQGNAPNNNVKPTAKPPQQIPPKKLSSSNLEITSNNSPTRAQPTSQSTSRPNININPPPSTTTKQPSSSSIAPGLMNQNKDQLRVPLVKAGSKGVPNKPPALSPTPYNQLDPTVPTWQPANVSSDPNAITKQPSNPQIDIKQPFTPLRKENSPINKSFDSPTRSASHRLGTSLDYNNKNNKNNVNNDKINEDLKTINYGEVAQNQANLTPMQNQNQNQYRNNYPAPNQQYNQMNPPMNNNINANLFPVQNSQFSDTTIDYSKIKTNIINNNNNPLNTNNNPINNNPININSNQNNNQKNNLNNNNEEFFNQDTIKYDNMNDFSMQKTYRYDDLLMMIDQSVLDNLSLVSFCDRPGDQNTFNFPPIFKQMSQNNNTNNNINNNAPINNNINNNPPININNAPINNNNNGVEVKEVQKVAPITVGGSNNNNIGGASNNNSNVPPADSYSTLKTLPDQLICDIHKFNLPEFANDNFAEGKVKKSSSSDRQKKKKIFGKKKSLAETTPQNTSTNFALNFSKEQSSVPILAHASKDPLKQKSCEIFTLILLYMKDAQPSTLKKKYFLNSSSVINYYQVVKDIIDIGITTGELRDEIYCQLIKQVTNHPQLDHEIRGWEMIVIMLEAFPPSKQLEGFFRWFLFSIISTQTTPPRDEKVIKMCSYCLHRYDNIWRGKGKIRNLTKTDIQNLPKMPFLRCFFGGNLQEIMAQQKLEVVDFSTQLSIGESPDDIYKTVKLDQVAIFQRVTVPKLFLLLLQSVYVLSNQLEDRMALRTVFANEQWDSIYRTKYQLEKYAFLDSYQLLINNVNLSNKSKEKITANISASLLVLWLEELTEPIIGPLQYFYITKNKTNIAGIEFVVFNQNLKIEHVYVFLYLLSFFRSFSHRFPIVTYHMIAATFGPAVFRTPKDVHNNKDLEIEIFEYILQNFTIPPDYQREISSHLLFMN